LFTSRAVEATYRDPQVDLIQGDKRILKFILTRNAYPTVMFPPIKDQSLHKDKTGGTEMRSTGFMKIGTLAAALAVGSLTLSAPAFAHGGGGGHGGGYGYGSWDYPYYDYYDYGDNNGYPACSIRRVHVHTAYGWRWRSFEYC
jgi:hypothetical protein